MRLKTTKPTLLLAGAAAALALSTGAPALADSPSPEKESPRESPAPAERLADVCPSDPGRDSDLTDEELAGIKEALTETERLEGDGGDFSEEQAIDICRRSKGLPNAVEERPNYTG
ncbi:hypothetical protein [Streptomonospora salina]|uniref:Secreted protein n=1 Tax=Streptomonospora salina TaxID=104205 RepID=A0A841EAJ0_9ACTN|nr:hypothetical protein [Streptomonospora salina]MBB5998339.1 hypothetical protein [Streptomonospora salina]